MLDPSQEEENVGMNTISIILTSNQEILAILNSGGEPLQKQSLLDCIQIAKENYRQIENVLKDLNNKVINS